MKLLEKLKIEMICSDIYKLWCYQQKNLQNVIVNSNLYR